MPKRSKEQRDDDLVTLQCMIIRGVSNKEMLDTINEGRKKSKTITRQTLTKDIAEVYENWRDGIPKAMQQHQAEIMAEYQESRRILWEIIWNSKVPLDKRKADVVVVAPADIPKLMAESRKSRQEEMKMVGGHRGVNNKDDKKPPPKDPEEALMEANLKDVIGFAQLAAGVVEKRTSGAAPVEDADYVDA